MSELHTNKETKEAVLGAVALANAGVAIAADKKIGLDDMAHLMVALPKVIAAAEGADKIPAEVLDLSTAEGLDLVASVATELSVGSEKAKEVVLASLEVLLGIRKIVVALTKADPVVVEAEAAPAAPEAPTA